MRFYAYLQGIKEHLEKDLNQASSWIKVESAPASLKEHPMLKDQWKIEKKTVAFNRQSHEELLEAGEVFGLSTGLVEIENTG